MAFGHLPSLIMRAPCAKGADTLAPRAITASFQVSAHQCFHLVRRDAKNILNVRETYLITESHSDNFAHGGLVKSEISLRRHLNCQCQTDEASNRDFGG